MMITTCLIMCISLTDKLNGGEVADAVRAPAGITTRKATAPAEVSLRASEKPELWLNRRDGDRTPATAIKLLEAQPVSQPERGSRDRGTPPADPEPVPYPRLSEIPRARDCQHRVRRAPALRRRHLPRPPPTNPEAKTVSSPNLPELSHCHNAHRGSKLGAFVTIDRRGHCLLAHTRRIPAIGRSVTGRARGGVRPARGPPRACESRRQARLAELLKYPSQLRARSDSERPISSSPRIGGRGGAARHARA